MTYPLVRELAEDGIPVTVTCRVLKFSTQGYYKWWARPICDRDRSDAHVVNAIVDIHTDDPEFGYRFIWDELEAGGEDIGERRVHRLCKEHRIWSTTTKKGRRGSGKIPGPAVHDDLVRRQFSASRPDAIWLTDITEHKTGEGKLYCCSFKDLFSNRIVGYAIGPRMTAELATSALRSAIARRRPSGTVVVHSDRGGQFRARSFRALLKAAKLSGSMGRVAAAGDNAPMESFYSLLQKNVLNRKTWTTRDELHFEIVSWIEHTYNRRRRQRALGRLTPVEFELAFAERGTVAA
jgi:transposase InsO family protein